MKFSPLYLQDKVLCSVYTQWAPLLSRGSACLASCLLFQNGEGSGLWSHNSPDPVVSGKRMGSVSPFLCASSCLDGGWGSVKPGPREGAVPVWILTYKAEFRCHCFHTFTVQHNVFEDLQNQSQLLNLDLEKLLISSEAILCAPSWLRYRKTWF